ncbi:MAG: penicillin acylase family protein [Saprospiraceae bacterium]
MKFLKLLLSLAVLAAAIYIGDTHGLIADKVPAMGRLFSPFTGFWQQAEPMIPLPGTIHIPSNIKGEVAIDERGIPHIFAEDNESAFFIHGYLHAKDRLFQMEITTRAASGRLAEVLGISMIERDILQRRKGITVAANRMAQHWLKDPGTAAVVTAYTAGVNAYLQTLNPKDYPVEFKILGFTPEPWTVDKSALLVESMAETLCFRNRDVPVSNSRAALGGVLFAHLFPAENPKDSPIIPADTPWDFEPIKVAADEVPADATLSWYLPELPQAPEGIGSNNWALAGRKTASGAPLLSNDPHLNLTLPSIWYEVHLHTPNMNVYGVSLPCVPGVVIGFNEQAAWGITNVGQDVLDWYRIHWTDATKTKYQLDGQAVAPEWVIDTVWVRGQEAPEIIRTPWTVFGPVVYQDSSSAYQDLAMQWIIHSPVGDEMHNNITSFLGLGLTKNVSDYQQALKGFDFPASNVVFADQGGNIALTVTGHYPLRQPQQGRFVQEGNEKLTAWQQYIPFSQIPRTVNPGRGYVSSANQRSTDLSYPYYYLGHFEDYRGRYINRVLDTMQQATPEMMMALQYDAHSLKAEEALPLMIAAAKEYGELSTISGQALSLLEKWDYRYTGNKAAPVLFDAWFDTLYQQTFDEIYALHKDNHPMEFPEEWRLIALMEQLPKDPIFDLQATERKEDFSVLAAESLEKAAAAWMPAIVAGLNWNAHRATNIPHLGRIPGFDSGLLHTDGAKSTPNALSTGNGPSWRMVVSLEKPIKAWGVLPGGASGNPGSPYYMNSVKAWAQGEYYDLHLYQTPEEVKALKYLVFGK